MNKKKFEQYKVKLMTLNAGDPSTGKSFTVLKTDYKPKLTKEQKEEIKK